MLKFASKKLSMFNFFKRKPKEQPKPKIDLSHLPALNEWGVFFQGNGINLYSRYAGGIPGTENESIYLKSYPEFAQLERSSFADWLYLDANGIFLQQFDTNNTASLVYINFINHSYHVISKGLTRGNWHGRRANPGTIEFVLAGQLIYSIATNELTIQDKKL